MATICIHCDSVDPANDDETGICEECLVCNTLRRVTTAPCSLGIKCDDEDHHYGLDMHVTEV